MALPAKKRFTYDDYLSIEAETGIKHEFFGGDIEAMTGGSAAHATLIHQLAVMLSNALRGSPCRPRGSEQKVLCPNGLATYPDTTVTCGPRQPHPEDPETLTNPRVIGEVLSPSTEGRDRGEKWHAYRDIPELRTYLLVASTLVRVERFEKQEDGVWTWTVHGPGDTLPLPSLGIELPVDDLYADALEDMAISEAAQDCSGLPG